MRQPRAAPPTVPIPPRTVEEQHFVDFDFDFPLPPSLTRIPHYGNAREKCVFEARGILERVQHREELVVFENAYGPDGLFDAERALAAYDHLHSQSHASNTRRRLQF